MSAHEKPRDAQAVKPAAGGEDPHAAKTGARVEPAHAKGDAAKGAAHGKGDAHGKGNSHGGDSHGGGGGHAEEAGGESVGIWYVSFADMITLLLAFFVMLSAFSSYDTKSMDMIQEASACARSYPHTLSVWENHGGQSVVSPVNESRMPTAGSQQSGAPGASTPPPEEPLGSALAYASRKVIAIPVDTLFLGQTNCLSHTGKADLALVVKYMRARPPGRVHLSCSPPPCGEGPDVEAEAKAWLARQWVVAGVLSRQARMPMDRIALSVGGGAGAAAEGAPPQIIVTLLSKETDR